MNIGDIVWFNLDFHQLSVIMTPIYTFLIEIIGLIINLIIFGISSDNIK
jgi:hypothetical protein